MYSFCSIFKHIKTSVVTCCRKNPEHFTEFSHAGDVSYDEHSDIEDDDIPDCPYGATCYRSGSSALSVVKILSELIQSNPLVRNSLGP